MTSTLLEKPKPLDKPSDKEKPSRDIRQPELHLDKLDWSSATAIETSLNALYQFAEHKADEAIEWYWRAKRPQSTIAQGLRLAAIAATVVGGLIPIIEALGVGDVWWHPAWFSRLGYFFLGAAAALLAFDRYGGFSSAWMRYVTSALALQTRRTRFRLEWASLQAARASASPSATQLTTMLQRLTEFAVSIDSAIEDETQLWVTEFKAALADVQRAADTEREAARPGSIEVTVTNGAQTDDGFVVTLDGLAVQTVRGAIQYTIGYVPPGLHAVGARGQIGGKAREVTQGLTVVANTVARTSLTLPP